MARQLPSTIWGTSRSIGCNGQQAGSVVAGWQGIQKSYSEEDDDEDDDDEEDDDDHDDDEDEDEDPITTRCTYVVS